jgi:hypothetical protein
MSERIRLADIADRLPIEARYWLTLMDADRTSLRTGDITKPPLTRSNTISTCRGRKAPSVRCRMPRKAY